MARIDPRIGDEAALQSVARADALGDAGEHGGERRPDRAVEDPDALEFSRAHQRDELHQIDPARELRALMLEIDHLADARLGGEQVLRAGGGQGEERDGAFRRRCRDGADERQMPDDIADPSFDLDDGGGRHVYDLNPLN